MCVNKRNAIHHGPHFKIPFVLVEAVDGSAVKQDYMFTRDFATCIDALNGPRVIQSILDGTPPSHRTPMLS